MAQYCLPTIRTNINNLGGVDEGRQVPRLIGPDTPEGLHQLGLFEVRPGEAAENTTDLGDAVGLPMPSGLSPTRAEETSQLSLFDSRPGPPVKRRRRKS